jgi:hypothetical protein
VQESVTISHRGSRYEIGSGRGFYAIWLQADHSKVEMWPQTPDGWHSAWSRFVAIEAPGSIVAVSPGPPVPGVQDAVAGGTPSAAARAAAGVAGSARLVASGLLAIGVALGVAGLFRAYLGNSSLASDFTELVPHLIYLAGWAASAVLLIWRGAWRPATGALLAVGVSAVTFGLFFADLGAVLAGGPRLYGAGLLLSLIGWLACAAGSVVAVLVARPGSPRRVNGREGVLAFALTAFAAVGAAIAFAPSWDSFTLLTPAGLDTTVTQGNAFSNPGWVIVGDVAVMAVLVAVVVVAALWQPIKLGAALVAGAAIPLVAQAISAVVQIRTPVSPLQFGISSSEAQQAGLTISSGLTPAFWIYCAFVLALVLIAARMLTSPAAEASAPATASLVTAGAGGGVAPEPGRTL